MSPKYLQVLLLFFIFTSCKNEPKEKELPLEFETISVIKKSGEGCLTDDFNCSVISLDLLKAKGPEMVAERINSRLREHVISLANFEETSEGLTYEEYAKKFIANKQKVEADFGETVPWRAIVTGSILSRTENLLSIAIASEIFTGGAHGYGSTSFFNFDPKTGESLEHRELFTVEFSDFAEKAFRERFDIPQGEPINSTGFWFEDDVFHLPINIGIDEEKVILIYNSYEVASYAEGDFRLEFTLEEVEPFLKFKLQ